MAYICIGPSQELTKFELSLQKGYTNLKVIMLRWEVDDRMREFIVFLHVLSAVSIGFYAVFPFLIIRLGKLTEATRDGFAASLALMNRIGQYVVIVAIFTGGYLLSDANLSGGWMTIVLILVAIMLAMSGIMAKSLKDATKGEMQGLSKAQLLSWINTICLVIILLFMVNRDWL